MSKESEYINFNKLENDLVYIFLNLGENKECKFIFSYLKSKI
jgi:hypothetical protein